MEHLYGRCSVSTIVWTRFLLRKKFLSTTGLPYAFTHVYMKQEESNVKGILNFSWGEKNTLRAKVSVFWLNEKQKHFPSV